MASHVIGGIERSAIVVERIVDMDPVTAVVVMMTTVDTEESTIESLVEGMTVKTLGMIDTTGILVWTVNRVGMEGIPRTAAEPSRMKRLK
jgi:hypothetical protein